MNSSSTPIEQPIKKPTPQGVGFSIGSLAVSYFRTVYLALSSALRRFTVLFGMGRRGTTSLWPPGKALYSLHLTNWKKSFMGSSIASLALASAQAFMYPIHKAIGSSRTGN